MSSKPNLADGELNPRSKLRLKLTTQRLTDEGRFPPKCTFRRGAFYPTFWPTWSLSPRTVRERHRLSDGVQSIGSIPAVTSAFVTSVCNARLRVHINTHTHTHRRRSRCIVVDFESRSIKPPTGARARAHVLHQIFHAVWLAVVARGRSSKQPRRWQTHPIYANHPGRDTHPRFYCFPNSSSGIFKLAFPSRRRFQINALKSNDPFLTSSFFSFFVWIIYVDFIKNKFQSWGIVVL